MIIIAADYFKALDQALFDIDFENQSLDWLSEHHGTDLCDPKRIGGYVNEIETLLAKSPDLEVLKGVLKTVFIGSEEISGYIKILEEDPQCNCVYLDKVKTAFTIFTGGLRKLNKDWKLGIPELAVDAQITTGKSFQEYFEHPKREALAECIKTAFAHDLPATLVILIHTLRYEIEGPLLVIGPAEFTKFHSKMRDYFSDTDIGKRQNYSKPKIQASDINNCKARIQTILSNLN